MKNLSRIFKWLLIPFGALVLLICFLFALMQTEWAKRKIREELLSWAAQKGFELKFDPIEGSPPFKLKLRNIFLKFNENDTLFIESANLRLSLLRFLHGTLALPYLSLENVSYAFEEAALASSLSIERTLPLNFSIRTLKINNLCIENKTKKKAASFSVLAKVSYKNKGGKFSLFLSLHDPFFLPNRSEISIKGNKKRDLILGQAKLQLKSTDFFEPFWTAPLDVEGDLEINMHGPWNSFFAFFSSEKILDAPLACSFITHVDRLAIPDHPLFNRKWESSASFLAWANRCFEVESCKIKSDLIDFQGSGELDASFYPQKGSATFSIPELALFSLPLQGKLYGKTLFEENEWKGKISSGPLKIAKESFVDSSLVFKTQKEGDAWIGKARFNLSNPTLTLEGSSNIDLELGKWLKLEEIQISGPNAKMAGALTYQFEPQAIDGALFGYAYHLNHFRRFLPGSDLEGNLGAELRFTPYKSEEGNFSSQSLQCHLLFKNLQCYNYLANEVTALVELNDIFGKISGKGSLSCEKLHLGKVSLSTLSLDTAYQEEKWEFTLDAKGKWKDPFEIQSSGYWKENEEEELLEFTTLSGFALKNSFTLEKPLQFTWSPDYFNVKECYLNVGHGKFFADIITDKEHAQINLHGKSLPLDFFTLAHPTFYLKGTSSFDATMDATKEGVQGHANLVLEEATILEQGQEEPLMAKGSLQAHLNQGVLQLHTDIKAIHQQFLEYTATIPIDYTLFPFSLHLNRNRPLSAELTMEGKLQEIFDFVNMGSNRFTGFLASHLFFSQTLSSPAVQGSIELQNGSYENYFTGTSFKDVEIKATAQNEKITFDTITAKDEQGNPVSMHGKLLLYPDRHFPYEFNAELSNVNAIRFDSVAANFTGPVHITGNTKGSLAKGDLLVPQAHLKIPDKIMSELPTLPIIYLNVPAHLNAFHIHPPSSFPFKLDLNLVAPVKVFVEGKGLKSEWKGHAHLAGSNMNYQVNGDLTLLKGEFLFGGKIFNLTQGEITFSDKPTQAAFIKLQGTLSQQGVTITAVLQGPFSSPQLTFESVPSLPTSSLLSLILFNKDISEISPFQALQLAQAIVSLSGGAGPDVLEAIRKSIGVDRLSIGAAENDPDQIAVQIGKYLTRGVMITLAQGATYSKVIVEVDLKKGFVFQAETEPEEQGKFTLKWNKNY